MKKPIYLAMCICALALSSCIKDADVLPTESDSSFDVTEPSADGNTSFVFSVQDPSATTKATGTVEDSEDYDQGVAREYEVNKISIYLFDAASKIFVDKISLEGITLTNETNADLTVEYSSDKFDVEEGVYNIYAVTNSSKDFSKSTEAEFLAYVDDTYSSSSLMYTIPTDGFMMTNRGADNQSVSICANTNNIVSIDLERVVAKIEVTQKAELFELKDEDENRYATITLSNFKIVNAMKTYYLYRHVADLSYFTEPTSYVMPTNFGDVSDDNGYVIDPYFFSKDASEINTFDDSFFFQPLDQLTSVTWSKMPSTEQSSSIVYCLENPLYKDAQLNGYTTGIVFEAKVDPTQVITSKGTIDIVDGELTSFSTLYYCDTKFYDSIATLEASLGGDIPNVDESTSTEDLQAKHITRLTKTASDFICYYNYWIKHYDNEDQYSMGVMEFGVVRNNHYYVAVSSVADLGTGEPEVDKAQPDEQNQTLQANTTVVPWIVRPQGDVELE